MTRDPSVPAARLCLALPKLSFPGALQVLPARTKALPTEAPTAAYRGYARRPPRLHPLPTEGIPTATDAPTVAPTAAHHGSHQGSLTESQPKHFFQIFLN